MKGKNPTIYWHEGFSASIKWQQAHIAQDKTYHILLSVSEHEM